jgi:cation transport regulator ChaB
MSNSKIKLEEITGTYAGTSEYQKYSELGQSRREITGIIGVDKKAHAYKMGAYIAKPFSVLGSAFGFATILISVAHQELFANVWWILFTLGLGVGVFFEYLSTANEDSFVGFNITGLTKTGIILILFIKSYAVFMHYQTSEQIAKSLTNGVNSSTISITPRAALLESQISDLETDIKDKRAEKNTDAYAQLLINSSSKYKDKRNSATESIAKIEDALTGYKESKKKKELELATLRKQC